jgi:hypothetical protein
MNQILFMKRVRLAIVALLVAVVSFNCQKELSFPGGNTANNNTPSPVTAVLQGNVLDENGLPAPGVSIKLGSQTATTDSRGYFRIKNAALDKYSSFVVAEKPGYFKAFRSFTATSGTNQVMIKLVKKSIKGTINAAGGGEVSLPEGAKIALPANGVVIASNGNPYAGVVNVYASYIDPTASDISQTVPGSFMANDKDNKRVVLSSYGMLAVELESSTGEKLQIKVGATATLTTPIPSSIQASAPSTIKLWYVNEQTGIWQEEGSAVKNGTNYVGEVKHFSFWNCDVPMNAVLLSMTIKNPDGLPLVHAFVRITRSASASQQTQAYGYTDSLGQVSGMVPSNEALSLDVLNDCFAPVYSHSISALNQNTDIGVLTVPNSSSGLVTLSGKLVNCSNAPVANGFALIQYDNIVRYAHTDANGNFATVIVQCSGSSSAGCQILGIDEAAQQQGILTSLTLTAPITNAGNISACGNSAAQFINYSLDGTAYNIAGSTDSLIASNQTGTTLVTYVMGHSFTANADISFNFTSATAAPGTYPAGSLRVQGFSNTTLVPPFNVVITNFPQNVGEFYEGSFSGQFTAQSATHTLNGSFRIRKQW